MPYQTVPDFISSIYSKALGFHFIYLSIYLFVIFSIYFYLITDFIISYILEYTNCVHALPNPIAKSFDISPSYINVLIT